MEQLQGCFRHCLGTERSESSPYKEGERGEEKMGAWVMLAVAGFLLETGHLVCPWQSTSQMDLPVLPSHPTAASLAHALPAGCRQSPELSVQHCVRSRELLEQRSLCEEAKQEATKLSS